MRQVRGLWGCVGLALAGCTGASASPDLRLPTPGLFEPEEPHSPAEELQHFVRDWTFRVEPSAWFASPGGDLRMPGATSGGDAIDLSDLELADPGLRPFIELHAQRGRWRISASVLDVREDGGDEVSIDGQVGDLSFISGDRLESSLEFTSFQVMGAYRIYRYTGAPNKQSRGFNVVSTIDIQGGLRFSRLAAEVEVIPQSGEGGVIDADNLFAEPVIGFKWTLDLDEHFTIDSEINFGGLSLTPDTEAWSLEVLVGGAWRPTPNIGVQLGYRFIGFSYRDGESPGRFEYNGLMAGLYGGIDIRF